MSVQRHRAVVGFLARFLVILTMALWSWPGWGLACSAGYARVANAVLAPLASSEDVRILFRAGDDPSQGEDAVPWQVYAYAQRAGTSEVSRFSYKVRSAYASVATFVALAAAWALGRWRGSAGPWLVALPVLLVILLLGDLNRVVLHVDQWGWISLGPVHEVVQSAVYTLMNGLPVMPFVLPGAIVALLSVAFERDKTVTEKSLAERAGEKLMRR